MNTLLIDSLSFRGASRRANLLRALLLAQLLFSFAAAAQAKPVRVFAVGPRFGLDWVDSRAHFAAKLDGMLKPLHRTGRDLAVLPEDIGLMAAFSGTRGAPARSVSTLVEAIGALLSTYSGPMAYYGTQYPQLLDRGIPTRLLAVGLTDTFGRVGVETFATLARRYHLWLEAGIDMARDWRIVCRDKATFVPPPGAAKCDVQDPALVAVLGDPDEPQRDYAYQATTPDPVNMALLFDPQGHLVAKQVKAYLTPTELPGQLDLVPGDPLGLTAIHTPVGRLGFVTSKDAWMPDVTGRLDDAGVQILVQPEFFVGDTVRRTGMWAPDTLKAAGYSDLLRHPSFRALALPELTGDVYDFSADAQSHIAVRGGAAGQLVGQDPAPGLVAVQPWLAPDPGGPMAQRRQRLGAAGEAAVGTGTQQEGVVTYDVDLTAPRYRPAPRRRDRPLAPSRHAQRHVALSSRGRHVWAAWDERGAVREAQSRDGGRHWSRPVTRGRGTHPALDGPRLVFSHGDVERPSTAGGYTVWLQRKDGQVGVYGGGGTRLDEGTPDPLAEQLDNAWAPSVAASGRRLVVTWVDFRGYQWDVYERTSDDGGATWSPQTRVNDSKPGLEALDDGPRAAFRYGKPWIAWTDFRKTDDPAPHPLYNVLGGANEQLDGDGARQIDAFAPAVAPLPGGDVAVAWQSDRGATADIRARRPGGPIRRVDDAGARAINSYRPAVAAVGRGRVVVAWEDDRDGPSNIFTRVLVLPSATSP